MIELRIEEVARATGGTVTGDGTAVVTAVGTDSRSSTPGDLFVALRGESGDGHDFTAGAVEAGASAVLVERAAAVPPTVPGVVVDDTWRAIGELGAHVRRAVDPTVVAITGSVGKTTTKDLVAAAVTDRPRVAAHGSFNNELGVPLTLLATTRDTRLLVIEIGARAIGHIASLAPWVAPDVSVVTAVAGSHLETFGDLDGVATAKGELVEALTDDGTAVLNAADPRVWAMRARTDASVVGYGRGGDVRATDVVVDHLGRPHATVETPWGRVEVEVPLPGRHNLLNALAAVAVAGVVGVPMDEAAAGLAVARVSPWRAEVDERGDGLVVCNDAYNANPTSAGAALDLLAALRRPGGRLVAVLGHMGELGASEQQGHEEVGTRAGEVADLVVAVGDTLGLAAAARAGGAEVVEVASPDEASDAVRGRVGADDVVLVKASRSGGLEVVAAALLGDDTPRDDTARPVAVARGGIGGTGAGGRA